MRLLPLLLTLFLLFFLLSRRAFCAREAVLAALTACGVLVVVITEGLGALHALTTGTLIAAWSVVAIATGLLVVFKAAPVRAYHAPVKLPPMAKIFFCLTAVIYAVLFVEAVCVPPNSWDGMTYHLSRVEHWVQNKSVDYFPTNMVRQNAYPPFSEWVILHIRLLTGHDRYANMVQFAAMTGSLVGVSLIARVLGAGIVGQCFAVFMTMCLPMGILQATSVQTDYVVTLWLSTFVYFLLMSLRTPGPRFLLPAAAAMGLACLTKGYSYAFALPFLVWWLGAEQFRPVVTRLVVLISILGTVLAVNAGFIYRNLQAFDKVVYSREQLTNTVYSLEIYVSNVLRFAGLHLITPWMAINNLFTRAVQKTAALLHIELDPLVSSFGAGHFELPDQAFNEDYAGNLLAGILFLVLIAVAVRNTWNRKGAETGGRWPYVFCLCAMFLLLSLVLRFQPFGTRFHLAIFVLAAAWMAWAMERFCSRKVMALTALVLWVCALPWLVGNRNKPLRGENSFIHKQIIDQYFHTDPLLKEHYQGAAAHLDTLACKDIALMIGEDSKEYLLWVALHERAMYDRRLEHIGITNPTEKLPYPRGTFKPCAVLSHAVNNPPVLDIPEGLFFRTWVLDRAQGNTRHTAIYTSLDEWKGK